MIDLTEKSPLQLSDKDRKLQEWERSMDQQADEAQRRADATETLDGRHKRKLLGAPVP